MTRRGVGIALANACFTIFLCITLINSERLTSILLPTTDEQLGTDAKLVGVHTYYDCLGAGKSHERCAAATEIADENVLSNFLNEIGFIILDTLYETQTAQILIFGIIFLNNFFCWASFSRSWNEFFIDTAPILGVIGTLVGLSSAVFIKFNGGDGDLFEAFSTATSTTVYGGLVYVSNYCHYVFANSKYER